jgi:dTDP-4-dehydrorhamnose reductase
MRVLVTGANGLVGQHLVKLLLSDTAYTIIATGKGGCRLPFKSDRLIYMPLDITDSVTAFNIYLQSGAAIFIHGAAMTQADECEQNKTGCWDVNVTATRFLLEAAKQVQAYTIYISTDFVFDGEKGNYNELDTAEPVNYYGSSKLAAEKAVLESGIQAAIARTCLVYGNVLQGSRSNIINWVKESLEQHKKIKVVSDQFRTPTYVEDLAKGILQLLEKKATGIFHLSGEEMMTPYDMAMATANHLALNTALIEEVNAALFTQPAKRPAKTGFDISKAKEELHYQPRPFTDGIKMMLG